MYEAAAKLFITLDYVIIVSTANLFAALDTAYVVMLFDFSASVHFDLLTI